MAAEGRPFRGWSLVLSIALLGAAALVVVLGQQVRSLRQDLREERRQALFPAAGQVVPAVPAMTLSGDSVLLGQGPPGSRQVLFVFNTSCGICVATLPAWTRVAERLADEHAVSVLAWSQDPDPLTRAYITEHRLAFPTVIGLSNRYLRLYHALGVPSTLVIDASGNVIYGRPGKLTPAAEDSIVTAALADSKSEGVWAGIEPLLQER